MPVTHPLFGLPPLRPSLSSGYYLPNGRRHQQNANCPPIAHCLRPRPKGNGQSPFSRAHLPIGQQANALRLNGLPQWSMPTHRLPHHRHRQNADCPPIIWPPSLAPLPFIWLLPAQWASASAECRLPTFRLPTKPTPKPTEYWPQVCIYRLSV